MAQRRVSMVWGIGKAAFMQAEHGEALDVMRSIKQTLDPKGIMNPGKVFPPKA
jgi:D-lactate dehydrogenase (cytochrome)